MFADDQYSTYSVQSIRHDGNTPIDQPYPAHNLFGWCYNSVMPFVALLAQTTPIDPQLTTRLVLALLCVVVLSSIAFGITFGLARRIAMIANQPSSQSDDDVEAHDPSDRPGV
jgi:hypothetical protein